MNALARLSQFFSSAFTAERDDARPVRPMTGFFDTLSPEQQKRALAYRGDETHGDEDAPPRISP
jgi:hypothetical protein